MGYLLLSNLRRFCLIVFLVLLQKIQLSEALWTPCNYPVPNDSGFDISCSSNYLHAKYVCDVEKAVSRVEIEKLDTVLNKYDLFSKKYVRVGVAVLRILEYPTWANVNFPRNELLSASRSALTRSSGLADSDQDPESSTVETKKIRRHNPLKDLSSREQSTNPDWFCLTETQSTFFGRLDFDAQFTNGTIVRHYVETFADLLRRRWFRDECSADLFFLAVTGKVNDHSTQEDLIRNSYVQVSYGQGLLRHLPSDYDRKLQQELSILSNSGWSFQPMIALAVERLAEKLPPQKLTERRMTTVIVDSNGQHRIVTAIVVQHTIPPWAIYTFIGCLGSVGLALGLEWTIVRRKTLSLRAAGSGGGGGGGGGERQRSSKSDNVQVHLYF